MTTFRRRGDCVTPEPEGSAIDFETMMYPGRRDVLEADLFGHGYNEDACVISDGGWD